MEHLMNQLVGRSLAQERERDLARRIRTDERRGHSAARRWHRRPPRTHGGTSSVLAHA